LAAALIDAATRRWDGAAIAAHARGFSWEANIDRLDAVLQQAAAPAGVATEALR
jgi:hypothetical protein